MAKEVWLKCPRSEAYRVTGKRPTSESALHTATHQPHTAAEHRPGTQPGTHLKTRPNTQPSTLPSTQLVPRGALFRAPRFPVGCALSSAALPPVVLQQATNRQTARGLCGGEGHRPSDRARPSSLTAAAPASVRRGFSAPRCEHLTPFQGSRPSGCATCSVDWAMPAIFSDASCRAFSVARRKTAPNRLLCTPPPQRGPGCRRGAVARIL